MNLMNTEWIEIEDLPRSKANESRKKALKGILDKLKTKYSTGDIWLKTPLEEKNLSNGLKSRTLAIFYLAL